jgi:hypothetical protein
MEKKSPTAMGYACACDLVIRKSLPIRANCGGSTRRWARGGLKRIVVILDDEGLWRPEWGQLNDGIELAI